MARVPAALDASFVSGAESIFAPSERIGERLVQRGFLRGDEVSAVVVAQSRWGCRFGDAMIAMGAITPVELAENLAEGFGLPFVDLIAEPPDPTLSKAAELDLYLRHLFLPWRVTGGAPVIACADPTPELRSLLRSLYGPCTLVVMTAKFDVIWAVQRLFREALSHDANFALDESVPELSARHVTTVSQRVLGAALVLVIAAGIAIAPSLAIALLLLSVILGYGANIAMRVLLFAAAGLRATGHRVSAEDIAALDEAKLPVFSIIAPMYREANMVTSLAAALKAIDYPAAKLDIKLVLEEDDAETIAAAKALRLDGRFEILTVPKSILRTKPRACNYALRFVRGTYVVIYDAEDRPEPDQLKKVVAAFHGAPPGVACFQARLNVYNARDNWLTRGLMAQTPQAPNRPRPEVIAMARALSPRISLCFPGAAPLAATETHGRNRACERKWVSASGSPFSAIPLRAPPSLRHGDC